MTKHAFLAQLRARLSGLPQKDLEERLSFYDEMIGDRMEEGLSEEEAVAAIGPVDQIVSQIIGETPLNKMAIEKAKPKRQLQVWEIVLIILGSPIWFSLLIAAFAVVLSLYVVAWSVVISLWAVFAALAGSALGCIAGGVIFICTDHSLAGIAVIAAGIVCAGLAIFAFFGCKAVTLGIAILSKKTALGIKRRFVGKENA